MTVIFSHLTWKVGMSPESNRLKTNIGSGKWFLGVHSRTWVEYTWRAYIYAVSGGSYDGNGWSGVGGGGFVVSLSDGRKVVMRKERMKLDRFA